MFFFFILRRPPRFTRTDTHLPTRRYSDLAKHLLECGDSTGPVLKLNKQLGLQSCESSRSNFHHCAILDAGFVVNCGDVECRSEEHTSELQSLMSNSYAVFCLQQKSLHIILYFI